MDTMFNDAKEIEYTMVLDASYIGSEKQEPVTKEVARQKPEKQEPANKGTDIADKAIERLKSVAEDPSKTMDRLYDAYEKMFLKEPTVLDIDDIYPHSYQWRTVDRYNLAKLPVLTEAVKKGRRIADTEAYRAFVEAAKNRKIRTMSWDV